MGKVHLADGSLILPRLDAPHQHLFNASESLEDLVSRLKPIAALDSAIDDLRSLLATEQEDADSRHLADDEVLVGVGTLIKEGRLAWTGGKVDHSGHSGGGSVKPEDPKPPPTPEKPKEKVHVTPKLDVEIKVVLFDRKIDPKKHLPQPTFIECSMSQSPASPPFKKGAKLTLSGAGVVEAYEDEKLTKKFDISAPIPNAKLTGSSPLKLYLKGTTKGKFELKLEVDGAADPFIPEKPVTHKMGVVEVQMVLHEQDADKLKDLEVDPDVEPASKYWDNIVKAKIPDQKALSDADKIKKGRRLHVQDGANFGRAKAVIKKLDAAQWPDGTDDYVIELTPSADSDKVESANGALGFADKDFDGKELKPIKVKDAKKEDKIVWVEGLTASAKALDTVLDAGVTGEGITKRNADWALFTVVEIKEVKINHPPVVDKPTAWNETDERFYVNFQNGPAGREIELTAQLTKEIEKVPIHFLLSPDKDNLKKGNWGEDLPKTWKWKDIDAAVKHSDRADRKKLLSIQAMTDAKGKAKAKVSLSRFGGDKFQPAAYIDQDAHLSKFYNGLSDLNKRKPVFSDKKITVWRKFWYQQVKVEGLAFPAFTGAEGQYTEVKAEMTQTVDLDVTKAAVKGFVPPGIYPKYMVLLKGGADDALVVSEPNKAKFFTGYKKDKDKPIKIPILICDAQWDPDGNSGAVNQGELKPSKFPMKFSMDKKALTPPLQGGNLVVSGEWIVAEKNAVTKKWTQVRKGNLSDTEVTIDPDRKSLFDVKVDLAAVAGPFTSKERIWIKNLVIQGADDFLGEYDTTTGRILGVYDPKEPVDFQNTIAHEVGHSLHQVTSPGSGPAGVPDHPNQYDKRGSHCNYKKDKCVMYESGPVKGSYNKYCKICHPYLLVQNMFALA